MYYAEPVYRPPSEASSLLVQATVGCSTAHAGHCYFCGSWLFDRTVPEKRFRIRKAEDIIADIEEAKVLYGPRVKRVFFLDSNALIMKTDRLVTITRAAYELFPSLERVSVYACATDILRKRDEDLEALRRAGLTLLYIGLESGSDEVLKLHNKGMTAQETVDACRKATRAGLSTSVTVILGLGGTGLSEVHARDTGLAISALSPDYFGALTLMVVPGTPVHEWVEKGTFRIPGPEGILRELRLMIENTAPQREMVLRTNHASNYLPLKGTLPKDQERFLGIIDRALAKKIDLRPEFARGL